jgi:hypothetical protein
MIIRLIVVMMSLALTCYGQSVIYFYKDQEVLPFSSHSDQAKTNKVRTSSFSNETSNITSFFNLDFNKTMSDNFNAMFDKVLELQPRTSGFIVTNAVTVILSPRLMSDFALRKGEMKFPLDLTRPENLGPLVELVAEAGYMDNLKVINAWGNYLICPTGHRDRISTVVFQGNVFGSDKYKVRSLEMLNAKNCLQGKIKTIMDDDGRYLCAIEIYLTEYLVRIGDYRFQYHVKEDLLSSIEWKINDELVVITPVSNVVFNAINRLDILVPDKLPLPGMHSRSGQSQSEMPPQEQANESF